MAKTQTEDLRAYRWMVASRVLAAAVGGYIVTSLATVVLAWVLRATGSTQAAAVLSATMWSFALYTVTVLWVFCTRSATRAWSGLALAGLVLAVLGWGLKP